MKKKISFAEQKIQRKFIENVNYSFDFKKLKLLENHKTFYVNWEAQPL